MSEEPPTADRKLRTMGSEYAFGMVYENGYWWANPWGRDSHDNNWFSTRYSLNYASGEKVWENKGLNKLF